MDHFVNVDRLPEGFRIPNDLKESLEYEPQTKRLVHHGFMSKEEYDRLVAATSDWSFIRKLEALFQQSTYETPSPPKGLRKIFAAYSHRRRASTKRG